MKQTEETSTGLLLHSRDFLLAAELVLNRATGVSLPAYFLLGRSVELSLKAFLLKSGMTPKQLKVPPFGHNLTSLLSKANKNGLYTYVKFDSIEVGTIELLSFDYMNKRLEYRITGGTYYLPRIEVTEEVTRRLVSGLEQFCNAKEQDSTGLQSRKDALG